MNYKLRLRDDQINKDGEHPIQVDISGKNRLRKRFNTKIWINKKNWLDHKQEIKPRTSAFDLYDRELTSIKIKLKENLKKLELGEIDLDQVEKRVTGKVEYGTFEDYVFSELKFKGLKPKTYSNYKNAVIIFKKYINFKGKKLRFEDVNQQTLNRFKREFFKSAEGKKQNSKMSFNSYATQLRAAYNHAEDDNIIFDTLSFKRKFLFSKQKTKWEEITPDDFRKAIKRANTMLQWESLALWLLAFGCRGLYWADFTMFKSVNVKKHKDYDTWANEQEIFIEHTRHKAKDQLNIEMLIKIDRFPTLQLLRAVKYSFAKRFFFRRPEFVPDVNDHVRIFNYNLEENPKFHDELINSYQKAMRDVLPDSPLKNARKIFNNVAINCEITPVVADLLIGHKPVSDLNTISYNKFDTPEFKKAIQEGHEKVLEKFEFRSLAQALFDRLEKISKKATIPQWIYDNSVYMDEVGNIYHRSDYTFESLGKYEKYFRGYAEEYSEDATAYMIPPDELGVNF